MAVIDKVFDKIFPPAEKMWENAGADFQKITVNGEKYELPLFGLGVDRDTFRQIGNTKELRSKSPGHRKIGAEVLCKMDVSGIPYLARVMIPDDQLRHDEATDFVFNRSTAFTTSINGYAERGSKSIVAKTHRPFIQTGAAYSGETSMNPLELLKVPKTLWEARNQSVFAQSETRVVLQRFLAERFDLPQQYAILGDSMAAMNQPAMYGYDFIDNVDDAEDELVATDSNIIGFHAKGRCVVEKIGIGDIPRFGSWLTRTLLGGVAASACLASEGKLQTIRGSVSLNPQFQASALTGTLRALASGEAGFALNFIPRDAGGLEVLYGHDDLSDVTAISERFALHPYVHTKVVSGGTHGAILHSLADKGRTEWSLKLSEAYDERNGQLSELDWRRINKVPEVDPVADFVESVRNIANSA